MKYTLLILFALASVFFIACDDDSTSSKKSSLIKCQVPDTVMGDITIPGACYSIDMSKMEQGTPEGEETEMPDQSPEDFCAQMGGEIVSSCAGTCVEESPGFEVCTEDAASSSSMAVEMSSSM